ILPKLWSAHFLLHLNIESLTFYLHLREYNFLHHQHEPSLLSLWWHSAPYLSNSRFRLILQLPFSHNRRSEEHTSELQSRFDIVCRLLLEKKNITSKQRINKVIT